MSGGAGDADSSERTRFAQLDTCLISDALDSMGLSGVLSGIRPMWDSPRVVGRVHTVELRLASEGSAQSKAPHLGARAIEAANAGDVIVVANEGRLECAGWGGLLTRAALRKELGAVVVDGLSRDLDEAIELRFPVFARGVTPRSARSRVVEGGFDVPVSVCEVTVEPGDLLIGDRSGVVVVSAGEAARVLAKAEHLAQAEQRMAGAIDNGTPVTKVLDHRYDEMTVGVRGTDRRN